jgi:hypothetical protein
MKNDIILPVLIGAAAAGAIAWFLISEDTEELREDLLEKMTGRLDSLKDQVAATLDTLKEKSVI